MTLAKDAIRITIDIHAPPEEVFPYFTETEKVKEWHGGDALCEPVPGGAFMMDIPGDNVVRGAFVEIDPPHRVVFTWGMEGGFDGDPAVFPEGSSTVEVTFDAIESGTRLTIRHSNLPNSDHARRHSNGWKHYMNRLSKVVMGKDPGKDEWRDLA